MQNRRLGPYALAITQDLVSETLCWALTVRRPPAGLIMHSNQGMPLYGHAIQKLSGQTWCAVKHGQAFADRSAFDMDLIAAW